MTRRQSIDSNYTTVDLAYYILSLSLSRVAKITFYQFASFLLNLYDYRDTIMNTIILHIKQLETNWMSLCLLMGFIITTLSMIVSLVTATPVRRGVFGFILSDPNV